MPRLIDTDEIRIKPEYMHDICGVVMIRVEDIARILNDMPTIEPEPHWIPCSERLPEKYGNYLVTTDDGEVDIGSCDPENKDRQDHFWSGCDADGFFWYGENIVIAWMPLPKHYMRGKQDE